MTLHLQIPKDVEQGLLARAAANGLSIDAYVERVLRNATATSICATSREDAVKRMQEFGDTHRLTLPYLSCHNI